MGTTLSLGGRGILVWGPLPAGHPHLVGGGARRTRQAELSMRVPGHSHSETARGPPRCIPAPSIPCRMHGRRDCLPPHAPACSDGRKSVPGLNQRFLATAPLTLILYFGTEPLAQGGPAS